MLQKVTNNSNVVNISLFILSYMMSYFFYLIPQFWESEIVRAVAMNWLWFCIGYILCSWKEKYEGIGPVTKISILALGVLFSFATLTELFPYTRITGVVLVIAFYAVVVGSKRNKWLTFLSENSFGIYLLHSPLVYITYSKMADMSPIVVILLNFIVFGGIAAGLTMFIRKTRLRINIGE